MTSSVSPQHGSRNASDAGTEAAKERADTPPPKTPSAEAEALSPRALATTRAATAWFATAAALVLLVLLIVLILQNQDMVTVHYLGFTGSLQMGTALLIAAVAGGSVVTTVGIVRITQLRLRARRARRLEAERERQP
jgi:uncharacterized integral membrane protein